MNADPSNPSLHILYKIHIDDAILDEFRIRADVAGKGYQTLINDALHEYLSKNSGNLEETLRKVIREELERKRLNVRQ